MEKEKVTLFGGRPFQKEVAQLIPNEFRSLLLYPGELNARHLHKSPETLGAVLVGQASIHILLQKAGARTAQKHDLGKS